MATKRLKDQICVIGAGCTPFGEHFDMSYEDLLAAAAREAMGDAGIAKPQIEAAWLGTAFPDAGVYKGRSGMDLAESIGLFDIPITRVSNYCATAAEAFRGAVNALLAGECNVALAVGVEKLRDRSPQESIVKMMVEMGHPNYQKGFTAAGTFAIFANRHFTEYGLGPKDLAAVSVKNHAHACLNPRAHYRKPITLEQALRSPLVADPLTLMDSCPTTDGAAALILVRAEDAGRYGGVPVYVKGLGLSVSSGWDLPFFDDAHDFLSFKATREAAARAYAEADIDDPRAQIDLAEVHDCFSIVELLTTEDLGFCEAGGSAALLHSGATGREGDIPVNVSGGLLSCGHPVGATGIRMIHEVCEQLRGRAGKRQIAGARTGLTHNIGGPGAVAAVCLFGKEAG
jgi:acetyl-CoA C-acetyltransferase